MCLPSCYCSIRAPLTERKRENGSKREERDASVLRCSWVWGGMLAGVCLRSTSLCYSMRCRGKVSEEALHVGSGCEAFHLETNAFPVQWAFCLSQASVYVHVCLRKEEIHIEWDRESVCLCALAGSSEYRTESDWCRVGKCGWECVCIYGCIRLLERSATGNSPR